MTASKRGINGAMSYSRTSATVIQSPACCASSSGESCESSARRSGIAGPSEVVSVSRAWPRALAAASARGLALETLTTADGPAMPLLRALDAQLSPLLEAQQAGDWITVADILEYDVAPLMPRFEAVIDSLR